MGEELTAKECARIIAGLRSLGHNLDEIQAFIEYVAGAERLPEPAEKPEKPKD